MTVPPAWNSLTTMTMKHGDLFSFAHSLSFVTQMLESDTVNAVVTLEFASSCGTAAIKMARDLLLTRRVRATIMVSQLEGFLQ